MVAAAWVAAAACGGPGAAAERADEIVGGSPIVTTERGPRGGQLVFVGHDGATNADLTRARGGDTALDRSPAYSPDGAWIAFASTRGRSTLAETSLWVVASEPGAKPHRLTGDGAVDRDPVWTPEGDALVFSSNRGGSFDLYALEVREGEGGITAAGEAAPLTETLTHALAPSVSPDGDQVVYMALDDDARTMTLWLAEMSTAAREQLTDGPQDMTPAWSPRGDAIAFSAPAPGRADADLHLIDPSGSERRRLADEPYADQSGPAFSADGRYVFATSVFRSVADGAPILSSVVVVDREDPERALRGLHDPVVVESRVGVAVRPESLRADEIAKNPPYADALRDAVTSELRRERLEQERKAPDAAGP